MSRAVPRYRRISPNLITVPVGATVVEIKMQGSIEAQMTINTFYYIASVIPTTLQLSTLLLNWQNTFIPLLRACMSSDWTLTKVRIDVVNSNSTAGQDNTTSAGLAGLRGAGHEPTQMGMVSRRVSGVKGQHGRGRFTLPAPATADITNSTITAAALITAFGTLHTALFGTVSDGVNNWTYVIAQRSPVAPRLVTATAPVAVMGLNLVLGTIRRRKIGRGR